MTLENSKRYEKMIDEPFINFLHHIMLICEGAFLASDGLICKVLILHLNSIKGYEFGLKVVFFSLNYCYLTERLNIDFSNFYSL